jgi:hypothetical protein
MTEPVEDCGCTRGALTTAALATLASRNEHIRILLITDPFK